MLKIYIYERKCIMMQDCNVNAKYKPRITTVLQIFLLYSSIICDLGLHSQHFGDALIFAISNFINEPYWFKDILVAF